MIALCSSIPFRLILPVYIAGRSALTKVNQLHASAHQSFILRPLGYPALYTFPCVISST